MAAKKQTAENAETMTAAETKTAAVKTEAMTAAKTFDKKQLLKSQRFAENNLAARAALKDGVKYTLEEAEKAVAEFLSK